MSQKKKITKRKTKGISFGEISSLLDSLGVEHTGRNCDHSYNYYTIISSHESRYTVSDCEKSECKIKISKQYCDKIRFAVSCCIFGEKESYYFSKEVELSKIKTINCFIKLIEECKMKFKEKVEESEFILKICKPYIDKRLKEIKKKGKSND